MKIVPPSFTIPPHLTALQSLVDRCRDAEARKALIVSAGAAECISREDACLMITANQLETA